jgi:hypothetical protein
VPEIRVADMADTRTATHSIETDAAHEAVLALLADPRRIPDWAPGFADVVSGHAGSGWLVTKDGRNFAPRVAVNEEARTWSATSTAVSRSARTAVDPPALAMGADMAVNTASVGKMFTTIAVLQILGRRHLSIDARIGPYLPADWVKGAGIDTVTFRELLTHRAGFHYDSGAVFTDEHAAQKQVRVGITPEDKAVAEYNNIDFSIFRDVNTRSWAGGRVPPGALGEAEQPLRGHAQPGRCPVQAAAAVAQLGDAPDVVRNGREHLGGTLGEHRGVRVVLALDDRQREPRMGRDVAEPGGGAERGQPERLRVYGEQRRCGVRATVGPGGGRKCICTARKVLGQLRSGHPPLRRVRLARRRTGPTERRLL